MVNRVASSTHPMGSAETHPMGAAEAFVFPYDADSFLECEGADGTKIEGGAAMSSTNPLYRRRRMEVQTAMVGPCAA